MLFWSSKFRVNSSYLQFYFLAPDGNENVEEQLSAVFANKSVKSKEAKLWNVSQ